MCQPSFCQVPSTRASCAEARLGVARTGRADRHYQHQRHVASLKTSYIEHEGHVDRDCRIDELSIGLEDENNRGRAVLQQLEALHGRRVRHRLPSCGAFTLYRRRGRRDCCCRRGRVSYSAHGTSFHSECILNDCSHPLEQLSDNLEEVIDRGRDLLNGRVGLIRVCLSHTRRRWSRIRSMQVNDDFHAQYGVLFVLDAQKREK